MVAGSERTGRIVEPGLPVVRAAGLELRAERFEFRLQPVIPADVVAHHVQHAPAAPELLAVLQLVDDRRAVVRMIGPDHDEQAHAEPDQPAGHPAQHQDRHRNRAPEPGHRDLDHVGSGSKVHAKVVASPEGVIR